MLADQATSKSTTTVSSAISLLRKDLGVLTEVLSQISWDDRSEARDEAPRQATPSERGKRGRRTTVGNALRVVNGGGGGGGDDIIVDKEKTVASKLGLGQDAVSVDLLISLIERRRLLASKISSSVLKSLHQQGFSASSMDLGPLMGKVGLLSEENDRGGEEREGEGSSMPPKFNTAMPLRNRASSAEGRYAVPLSSQCSQEVKNLLGLMNLYRAIVKGFYVARSFRDGVWTGASTKELAQEPDRYAQRRDWVVKRHNELYSSFLRTLQNDVSTNNGLSSLKTLNSRESVLASRMKASEGELSVIANNYSKVGHLKDTVSMLEGALTGSINFYKSELGYLQPKVNEAAAVSDTIEKTVETVEKSSASLLELFNRKGAQLERLQRLAQDDEADRRILQVEKDMWRRRMSQLETEMSRRERLARVAAASVKSTREINDELLEKVEGTSEEVKKLKQELEGIEDRVEQIYNQLHEYSTRLDAETTEAKGKGRELERVRYLLGEKKTQLKDLKIRRDKRGAMVKLDVEKDTKRMQLKMKHLKRKEEEMKLEMSDMDQKVRERDKRSEVL